MLIVGEVGEEEATDFGLDCIFLFKVITEDICQWFFGDGEAVPMDLIVQFNDGVNVPADYFFPVADDWRGLDVGKYVFFDEFHISFEFGEFPDGGGFYEGIPEDD